MADHAPGFDLAEGGRLALTGAWRMAHLSAIVSQLSGTLAAPPAAVDASALTQLDSASALLLLRMLRRSGPVPPLASWQGLQAPHARTLGQVLSHLDNAAMPPPPRRWRALARLGATAGTGMRRVAGHLSLLGETVSALGEAMRHPKRLRLRELAVQAEQAGLSALPVVALVTALIGVVIAYLLGLQAEKYGANLFVVDGVAIGATREFAPIIVAVI
ncbi:MAG: ABC transporter permease, partial [Rhodoferax sp.]|nr:ABC transporter permease [Rhodoferax sp.]